MGSSRFVTRQIPTIRPRADILERRVLLAATFQWSMPDRFGGQLDDLGLPLIPNTIDYARPNATLVDGVARSAFPVRFDASGTTIGTPVTNYEWRIDGPVDRTLSSSAVITTTNLPEGRYDVTLVASGAGGASAQASQAIDVVDHLVVAIGDSYSSGEGNPSRAVQANGLGFVTADARWATGGNAAETAWHDAAHRSHHAGAARAALALESGDPHSSVTFLFLSESGATVETEVLGLVPREDGRATQLQRLRELAGNRTVDALAMSLGGNDIGFADIIAGLVQAEPSNGNYQQTLDDIWATYRDNERRLRGTLYPRLAQELYSPADSLDVAGIYITEYPDQSFGPDGQTLERAVHDILSGLEIDRNELNLARANVVEPLNATVRDAAASLGWAFVTDISNAFRTHGYGTFAGAWIRTATDSARMQGPIVNVFAPSFIEKASTSGTAHPTADGHQVYADRIGAAWRLPDLVVSDLTLTPDALRPSASDGFVVTVTNQGLRDAAPPSVLRLYLSDDLTVTTGDVTLHDVAVPALGAGQSLTIAGAFPAGVDPFRTDNSYFVGAVADASGVVVESAESNNAPAFPGGIARPVRSELDFDPATGALTGLPIVNGVPRQAALGSDEFIGAYDVDVFPFTVGASAERLAFDIDTAADAGPDTHVRIYRREGTTLLTAGGPLASNDDGRAPSEAGGNPRESYLVHTFDAAGEYALVVASAANAGASPVSLAGRVAGETGPYTVTLADAPITAATVVARHVFYNGTALDGNDVGINAADDNAIAANKQALLAGAASPANHTAFAAGINGIMIEVAGLPAGAEADLDVTDFTFRSGPGGAPSGWSPTPGPNAIGVRRGAGTGGSDRVTLVWSDATAVRNAWLQVTVNAGPDTALAAPDVFYYGNLVGDSTGDRTVSVADVGVVATNFGLAGRTPEQGDLNADQMVTVGDVGLLATRFGATLAAPTLASASATIATPSLSSSSHRPRATRFVGVWATEWLRSRPA